MKKILTINRYTGIDKRPSIGTPDHPLVNGETAPSIGQLHDIFVSDGVPLAISAARTALAEAGLSAGELTHMVSTTCTDSANPGYDHFVAKALGVSPSIEKVLLHGVGCAGGLAALRTAANLCLGHAMRGLPARALVVALEISTTMVRSEMDSINALQQTRIGITLFSDGAGAMVLSNGIGDAGKPVYDLLGWEHRILPETEAELGFDVDPCGWKVVLSPQVPVLAQAAIAPAYHSLLASLPPLPETYASPADFDWAMHPGGATILSGAEKAMGLTPEHMRASYDTYINHGNTSSATVISVLDRLRQKDMDAMTPGGRGPREYVVACAFGPGIAVEICMLRRRDLGHGGDSSLAQGLQTPPETESEGSEAESRSVDEEDDPEVIEEKVPKHGTHENGPVEEASKESTRESVDDIFISEALAGVELD
jgi:type III polyketide synthase